VQLTRDGTPGKNNASYLMAYFPQHVEATIDTSRIAAAVLRGWWFNPREGTSKALPSIAGEKSSSFSPPSGHQDEYWVLVLDDPSKGYPPPGVPN